MQRTAKQRGYSLVEALIATALLAGLASALAPAVFGSIRISSAILQDGKTREAIRSVDGALTQIFSNSILLAAGEPKLRFEGAPDALRVVSFAGNPTAARVFKLTIENGALLGTIQKLDKDDDEQLSTNLFPANVSGFSYYGRATERAPIGWRKDWKGKRPPQLVRVEIKSEDGGRPVILEYALSGGAPLHCAFDPVSRKCRD
ncbi:MAG: hypothetical protein GXP04_10090 [Alphaproteobacteria bacterium]|nr:hypothetical protein [Alphaproteobacteria bacterium]